MKTTMDEIAKAAAGFSEAHRALEDWVNDMQAEQAAITAKYLPKIKSAVGRTAVRQAALKELVEANPELFTKPRSVTFGNVKAGYRKGAGAVVFEDEAHVLALIHKKLPGMADELIKTEESVVKAALKELDVKELALIGCKLESTEDVAFAAVTASPVAKVVKALLKNAEQTVEERMAA